LTLGVVTTDARGCQRIPEPAPKAGSFFVGGREKKLPPGRRDPGGV